uniref:Uncharacterized protein n=1 Tax=Arundo donax TaxID=35708 RepID=A0A0A9E587_ARUDO
MMRDWIELDGSNWMDLDRGRSVTGAYGAGDGEGVLAGHAERPQLQMLHYLDSPCPSPLSVSLRRFRGFWMPGTDKVKMQRRRWFAHMCHCQEPCGKERRR